MKDTILLESTEGFQIVETKHKKVVLRNKEGQQSSKKAKEKQLGKYCGSTTVKIESVNLYKRYMYTRQDCLVYNLR